MSDDLLDGRHTQSKEAGEYQAHCSVVTGAYIVSTAVHDE